MTLPFYLPGPLARFWNGFISGQIPVDVFIILSGFVITLLIQTTRCSWVQFMTGRFFRIYPVYLVCLTFAIAIIHLTPGVLDKVSWHDNLYLDAVREQSLIERSQTFIQAFCHLTLLFGIIPHALLPEATATFLPPAWSISLEWQFYLFAILIVQKLRSIGFILFMGAVGCAGVWYAHYWQNPHIAFLPSQLPLFLIGIGSYRLYSSMTRDGSRIAFNPAYAVAAVVAASVMFQWHWVPVCIWALVLGTLFANEDDWFSRRLQALRRSLLHPWLQLLGRISYPLYLVHWPMIIVLMFGILRWQPQVTSLQAFIFLLVAGLPCILAAAWLLHRTVELPLMKLGKRKSPRTNQARPLTNGSANP